MIVPVETPGLFFIFDSSQKSMIQSTDQTGQIITLQKLPQRIISLVPSQTELLYNLGLDKETIAITRFCIHPEIWHRSKNRIGGTKDLQLHKIKELQPDLVIANKEENSRSQVEEIKKFCPVWTSDIANLIDALEMIREIGQLTGKSNTANMIATEIETDLASVSKEFSPLTAAYLIWKDPFMAAGGDTFINEMMKICGLNNVFSNKFRYPEVTLEEIEAVSPNVVLLSSEPYPFRDKHIRLLEQQLPGLKISLADGEMFSWYGSRLLHSANYFRDLRAAF
jgi:ABC-type Fe3+-hydroxamate transport system substrate-binding protein